MVFRKDIMHDPELDQLEQNDMTSHFSFFLIQ